MGKTLLALQFLPDDGRYCATLYVNKPVTRLTADDVAAIDTAVALFDAPVIEFGVAVPRVTHTGWPSPDNYGHTVMSVRLAHLVDVADLDRSNLHRTLSRLLSLGLVDRSVDAEGQPAWTLSTAGRMALVAMGALAPIPPTSAPAWGAPDPTARAAVPPTQTVEA